MSLVTLVSYSVTLFFRGDFASILNPIVWPRTLAYPLPTQPHFYSHKSRITTLTCDDPQAPPRANRNAASGRKLGLAALTIFFFSINFLILRLELIAIVKLMLGGRSKGSV